MTALFDVLERERLLPLAVVESVEHATSVLDDVRAAGRSVLEIGLRSASALDAIGALASSVDVLVGAGTVVSTTHVEEVVAAGAKFVVTPGFDPAVVARCLDLGVTVLPGVATPGAIMGALGFGLDTVKLFPASVLGGVAMVDALRGPFPGVRLVPSGGIDDDNARKYLSRSSVLAVSRSWRAPSGGSALTSQGTGSGTGRVPA